MNVFAQTLLTTLCVSTVAFTATWEQQNIPAPHPNPAPTQAPDGGDKPQPPVDQPANTQTPAPAPAERPAADRQAPPEALTDSRYPRLNASDVDNAIASWDPRAKQAMRMLISKYGEPNEMTSRRAYWYENGPWLWTCVRNEPIANNWPRPHAGVIEQAAAARIPMDRAAELARFSGALLVDRNEGVLSYRSDNESWNVLAINLAYQVAGGNRDAESARREFERLSLSSGEPSPLMERFTFTQAAAGLGDPDREVGVPGSPATNGKPSATAPTASTPVTPSPLPIERPRVPEDERKKPR